MLNKTSLRDSIGYRHIIEDALLLLEGEKLSPQRRTFVLRALAKLVEQASGSPVKRFELSIIHASIPDSIDAEKKIIEENLAEAETWADQFAHFQKTLGTVETGGTISPDDIDKARIFLDSLLNARIMESDYK